MRFSEMRTSEETRVGITRPYSGYVKGGFGWMLREREEERYGT